ncbi:hypothetical protein NESM_000586700 [Novymonas esmeraldas]|uniref:Uncharacterized protein n=1 Tax=Novymonas esmeraldas TaxID=1808958 RepID=A0AAW0ESH2_9TRYP
MSVSSTMQFDAFHVETWSRFVEQDDPRMISYELRAELEAAYDVHAYSARCRQAVLKSLLLWAGLARAQRHAVQWNAEDNVSLGQGLVQHLLDLTAETQGINTDEIYAALRAEQHPFLKKMHEAMRARGGSAPTVREHDRGSNCIEARHHATRPLSPTPRREPTTLTPLRPPTVLEEPPLLEKSVSVAPVPPLQPTEVVAVAALELPPVRPQREPVPCHSVESPVAPTATTTSDKGTAPPTALPPAPVAISATPLPPTNGNHVSDPKPPQQQQQTNGAPARPVAAGPPAAPRVAPLKPEAVERVRPRDSVAPPPAKPSWVHPAQAASWAAAPAKTTLAKAPAKHTYGADPAAAAPPPPPPPSYSAATSTRAPPRLDPPAPASMAKPGAAAAAAPPPPPPAPASAGLLTKRTAGVYTDSEDTASVRSEADKPDTATAATAAVEPKEAAGAGAHRSVTEALSEFADGGKEDLVQAFCNDLPADPNGVPAWFQRRLAVSQEDRQVPLLASPASTMSLDEVKRRMEPKVAKRLEQLFQHLYVKATATLPPTNEAAALLSAEDVKALAAAELIRACKPASDPDTVLAFTAVENGPAETLRRRFHAWPRGSNENAINSGYEPHVPLHHISTYLPAVNAPFGCVETFETIFDQLLLPKDLQERFVFTDARGQKWCTTRLPLGHTVSMEIIQICISTLCGHPSYTLPQYAVPNTVRVDVWVHTARFYGPEKDVTAARERMRAACEACGVTPTKAPGGGSSTSCCYDFLGVHFDHAAKEVSVAAELVARTEKARHNISTRDLERQYTQMLFCSSIQGVAASAYYSVLREVCTRLAALQSKPKLLHSPTRLPQEAMTQMQKWYAAIVRNRPRNVETPTLASMTLFVELEEESWKAVLVGEDTQETWNAEGSLDDMLGTRVASASITRAVECFQPCIDKGAHVSIKIIGGGAMGRNEKPIYRNEPEEGISECIRTHLVTRSFSFEVAYLNVPPTPHKAAFRDSYR